MGRLSKEELAEIQKKVKEIQGRVVEDTMPERPQERKLIDLKDL